MNRRLSGWAWNHLWVVVLEGGHPTVKGKVYPISVSIPWWLRMEAWMVDHSRDAATSRDPIWSACLPLQRNVPHIIFISVLCSLCYIHHTSIFSALTPGAWILATSVRKCLLGHTTLDTQNLGLLVFQARVSRQLHIVFWYRKRRPDKTLWASRLQCRSKFQTRCIGISGGDIP